MNVLMIILTVVVLLGFCVVASIRPLPDEHSLSELKRRAKGAGAYARRLKRQQALEYIRTLLQAVTALLLVVVVLLLVVTFGWFLGIVLAVIVVLLYPALSRVPGIVRMGRSLYEQSEPALLEFATRYERFFYFLRDTPFYNADQYRKFDSHEELAELIEQAGNVLTDNERSLVVSTLGFGDKRVSSAMTPRTVIDSVKKGEFLGPLVLDELHALGHSRLPVIDGDLDHVIGILHLRDLLSLDVRKSATSEKVMEPKVYYIHQDDFLEHALGAFLRTRHHLFIVINDSRETVGLLTLEDVIEALIGRRIVDEDDIHADLQAVARQAGKANNNTPGHVDL